MQRLFESIRVMDGDTILSQNDGLRFKGNNAEKIFKRESSAYIDKIMTKGVKYKTSFTDKTFTCISQNEKNIVTVYSLVLTDC